jgi:NAD(P)-dependent dehydrogenase (short-subunit alcohol dehydrogenase family)
MTARTVLITGCSTGIGRATREAYEKGPLVRLGGEPDDVAKAVEKAIGARRAPIRVRVTPSAHLLITQRRLLGDRAWDAFVGTPVPPPARLAESHEACPGP